MEEEIIQPIDKALLKSELTPERQLRMTNKSNNEIYVVTAHDAPNVMKEIGRLREIAFRTAGGGTGKAWISTSSTLWKTAANSSSCGTPKQRKSSEVTVISLVLIGKSMPTGSQFSPQVTCSISLNSS